MKRLFKLMVVIGLFLTGVQASYAATGINRKINFQGKVVNKAVGSTDGTNVTDGNYNFIFTLWSTLEAGTSLWRESWNGGTTQVQVISGNFQVALGTYATFPPTVDFNSDSLFLSVNYNGDGDMAPRIQMAAVPYAFNAEKVAGLTVTNSTGTLTIPNGNTITFGGNFTTMGMGISLDQNLNSAASPTFGGLNVGGSMSVGGTVAFTNIPVGTGTTVLYIGAGGNLVQGTISTGSIYTATNGLTLTGEAFGLGGSLTQSTQIGTSSYSLSFVGLGGSQALFVDLSGNVGIGDTASSSGPLAIGGSGNVTFNQSGYVDFNYKGVRRLYTNVITVNPNGGADYTTLASALAAAVSGDTIYLMPGTYSGNTTIPSGVSVIGADRSKSIINDVAVTRGPVMTLMGDNTISNLTINAVSGWNYYVLNFGTSATGAVINSVTVNQTSGDAVAHSIIDTTNWTLGSLYIQNCSLTANQSGSNSGGTYYGIIAHSLATASLIKIEDTDISILMNNSAGVGVLVDHPGTAMPYNKLFYRSRILVNNVTLNASSYAVSSGGIVNSFDNMISGAVTSGVIRNEEFVIRGIGNTSNNTIFRSIGDTGIALILRGGTSQTANILQIGNSAGTGLSAFSNLGYLGVGITSPSKMLDVSGDINLTGTIYTAGTSGAAGQVLSTTGTGLQWITASGVSYDFTNGLTSIGGGNTIGLGGTLTQSTQIGSSDFDLNFVGLGGSQSLFVGATGNVGIGTTNPNYKLEVNGAILGTKIGVGATGAKAFNVSSDASIGTNLSIGGSLTLSAIPIGVGTTILYIDGSGNIIAGTIPVTSVANSKVIVLSPEFPGASLSKDGSTTNDGSLTSDNVLNAGGSGWNNYYEWSSTNAALQDYSVIVRIMLPSDFNSWETGSCPGSTCALEMNYQTGVGTTDDNSISFKVTNDSDTPGSEVCSIGATASTPWSKSGCTEAVLNDGAAPEWDSAGEIAVIRIKMAAKNTSNALSRLGDIVLRYRSRF